MARVRLLEAAVLSVERAQQRGGLFARAVALVRSAIARLIGRANLFSLRWLDEAGEFAVQTLAPALESVTVGPKTDSGQSTANVIVPSVQRYDFADARVSAGSSSVLLGDEVLVERPVSATAERFDFTAGHLVAHGEATAMIRLRSEEKLEAGIFLGGNGCSNYYHWIIDLLPKLEYLPVLQGLERAYPVLIPDEAMLPAQLLAALKRLCPDRELIKMTWQKTYRVQRLVYLNAPNSGPINLRRAAGLTVGDYAFRPDSVSYLRRGLGQPPERSYVHPARRIFLARRGHRRRYNQDELIAICRERGFEDIYCEDLTLDAQISAFTDAAAIVGPSGASWTNMVFAQRGARCLSWLPEMAMEFSAYSTLADIVEADLRFMSYRSDTRSTQDLYRKGYHLDPTSFRKELDAVLNGAGAEVAM